MKSTLRVLVGRLIIFMLLIIAIVVHDNWGNLTNAWRQLRSPATFSAIATRIEGELKTTRQLAQSGTEKQLERRLTDAKLDLTKLREKQARKDRDQGFFARLNPLPELDPEAVELGLQIKAATIKVSVLSQALKGAKVEFQADLAASKYHKVLKDAADKCNNTAKKVHRFDQASIFERTRQEIFATSRADLILENQNACHKWKQKKDNLNRVLSVQNAARNRATSLRQTAVEVFEKGLSDLRGFGHIQDGRTLRGYWTQHDMNSVLLRAAGALLLIILTPYLIRILFYYILAPVAERRRSIRLSVPGSRGAEIPLPPPSATSVQVQIADGEELLIREGFLQSSSLGGEKRWVALLDWRHPLASWVTGLVGLTRIRGKGQHTTISPSQDPFAEVTELTIPAASALILHPRALVAVIQPVDKPMRIASHWRLFSLSAWLTLQLRFLVFYGPARIVIRGGRGVRVERAEQGRVFAQDQLVGFSADLAYSVTRSEIFVPYLSGRTSLFRDRVDKGDGILIIEEAPLSARGGGNVKRGLEGAFDAALKVFGI